MSRSLVAFDRLGPYHVSRLTAAAKLGPLVALELFGQTEEYGWDQVTEGGGFERITLFPDRSSFSVTTAELKARVADVLSQVQPHVAALPGWADKGSLVLLQWCRRASIPAVVMSESQAQDHPRSHWKEALKRRLIRTFSAGLVGGERSGNYLASLGMPRERIFTGYDVVDNDYFAGQADLARQHAAEHRRRLGVPDCYFLASSRFIEVKNLFNLLRAYALYRDRLKLQPWKLVLLGDGPLRPQIVALRSELHLQEDVLLPGFKQYSDLPAYYGLAKAFVLASTREPWGLVVNEAMAAGLPVIVSERAGCVPDLVKAGVNGYTFEPLDVEALSTHFLRLTRNEDERAKLAQASRTLIGEWSPLRFAVNLWKAFQVALAAPQPRRLGERLMLAALTTTSRSLTNNLRYWGTGKGLHQVQ